jgi:hypothetical protein
MMDEKAMNPTEYREQLKLILSAARIVACVDVPKLISDIERADVIAPLIDPTLWMTKHREMEEDRQLLEAALPLHRKAAHWLEKTKKEETHGW